MKNILKILIVFVLVIFVVCNYNLFHKKSEIKLKIDNFDHYFFSIDSLKFKNEIELLKKRFPEFFMYDIDLKTLSGRYNDNQIKSLFYKVDSVFKDIKKFNLEIEKIFTNYFKYFPKSDSIKVYTWVSNFESLEPIIVKDNLILISLDMFLGKNSIEYSYFPNYIKSSFNKFNIPSKLFNSYFESKIQKSNETNFLSQILDYGKVYYLTSLILKNEKPNVIFGCDERKMKWCINNQELIWKYFIEQEIIFSSDIRNKQRFIDDAPFSKFGSSIDHKSPGGVGKWIGWKIIESYMLNNPEVTLNDLINEYDSKKILNKSRYKGKLRL